MVTEDDICMGMYDRECEEEDCTGGFETLQRLAASPDIYKHRMLFTLHDYPVRRPYGFTWVICLLRG